MTRFGFLLGVVLSFTIWLTCSRDHSEMNKLKKHLTSYNHTQHLQAIIHSVDLFKMGYDNPILNNQLDSLQQAIDAYIVFIKSHQTRHKSVRQRQLEVLQPATKFKSQLMDIRMRLDAFGSIRCQIDSLTQIGKKHDIQQLERQEKTLRQHITNKALIQYVIQFMHRINRAITILDT